MKKVLITIVSMLFLINFSIGQLVKCNCNLEKLQKMYERNKGINNDLKSNEFFPITTFYRWNDTWFDKTAIHSQNIANMREMFKNAIKNSPKVKMIWDDIFESANASPTFDYDPKDGGINPDTRIAKNAAFVALMNLDSYGHDVIGATNFATKALKIIGALEGKSSENAAYYRASLDYYSRHFWINKNLVNYLYAIDYLRGLTQVSSSQSFKDSVHDAGLLLQCFTSNVFNASNSMVDAALFRQDNHGLTSAGAIGLASLVLGDFPSGSLNFNYKPNEWSSMAHLRTNQILWGYMEGGKQESLKSSKVTGFAEGTHYFRFAFENVLPFMLAYKNVTENDVLFKYYLPKGIYLQTLFDFHSPTGKLVTKNYWNDPNFLQLFEWFGAHTLADGTYLSLDDSEIGLSQLGMATIRQESFYPSLNLNEINYLNLESGFVDMRSDIAAMLSEGYFQSTEARYNSKVFRTGGIAMLDLKAPPTQMAYNGHHLYLHINAESEIAGGNYFGWTESIGAKGGTGHEHYDALSFSLVRSGAGDSKYLLGEPGHRNGKYSGNQKYKDLIWNSWNHNTICLESPNGKFIGPTDGESFLSELKSDAGGQRIVATGYISKGTSTATIKRTFLVFNNDKVPTTIIITDEVLGEESFLENNKWTNLFHGYDAISQSNFNLDTLNRIANWDLFCNSDDLNINLAFEMFGSLEKKSTLKKSIDIDLNDDLNIHSTAIMRIRKSKSVKFVTIISIGSCSGDWDIYRDNAQNGAIFIGNGKRQEIIKYNDVFNTFHFSDIFRDSTFIALDANGQNARFIFEKVDTTNICSTQTDLVEYYMDSAELLVYNSIDTIFQSTKRVSSISFQTLKKYEYSGTVLTYHGNDTLIFYIPEVPPTNLSLMTEQTGLNYSYDTTTQKITLYLPDSGSYNFSFGPSNPCAVSCFYPPDSIYYHFEHQGTAERLGHILDIKTDTGWLDMRNGAKMQICAQAVCRNHDSLTLSSDYACKGNSTGNNGSGTTTTKGYTSYYLGIDGAPIRTKYRFGSGAGLASNGLTEMGLESPAPYTEVRTMIVVENGGALVLKSGSHTVVGNGSTILVKPGGTLKIEDGAYLTIGSHDSIGCGFGEIIIMDSAFLCVGADAHIAFYNKAINSYDSIDVHIFYISQNPKNPAINSVAPTSNAETSGVCLPFCDLKTAFPEFGIENYKYGWLNVATPQANLQTASMVCDGEKVYANGLYSLNETRYRFEVCKYNTGTSTCIGAADTIPLNDTDNYFGGRLQGSICLSDYYIFERGHNYKIRFTIKNDCGDSDYVDKIIKIPALLQAQITGDTVICGGTGAITVSGTSSFGSFDSLRWEVWAYKAYPVFDSATYFANADTFVSFRDTFWLDSVTIDTILVDTFWFYKTDTIDNDSMRYAKYYRQFWDTTIVSPHAEDFTFDELFFYSGRKYRVLLTLYNQCAISTDSLMIRIKDGPTVSAGNDKYIPYGSPTVPNPILNGSVGSTVSSYVWSPSTGLSSTTVLSPTATPSTNTTYILAATDADGCTNYDSVLVWVNTIAHAGKDTVICHDDSMQVGNAAVSGYSYQWSPSNLVSNANIAQPYAYSVYGGSNLQLQVFNGTNELVGVDDIFIDRDTIDVPNFNVNPSGPYTANFGFLYAPISKNNIDWDFDDGTGIFHSGQVTFNHSFPMVPLAIYNVCASYTNACGLQETCKNCEFDAMGNVIPTPNPSIVEEVSAYSITVWPNPFTNSTVLEYLLIDNQNAYVEIVNLNGKVIKTIRIIHNSGKVELNLSQQAEGVYQYRFINGNKEIENGKLVLIK